MRRKRNYQEEWARRKAKKAGDPWAHRVAHCEGREPSPQALAERKEAYGFWRDPIAELLGDPPVVRSALFQKRIGAVR